MTSSVSVYFKKEIDKLLANNPNKAFRVDVKAWSEKRSISANDQTHVWYPIIAKHIGSDAKTVKARCKIDFGVPILLGANDEYSKVLSYIFEKTKFWQMSYEQQEKMIQGIAVTSKMSTPQCNEYRDNMQAYWAQNGLILEYKK